MGTDAHSDMEATPARWSASCSTPTMPVGPMFQVIGPLLGLTGICSPFVRSGSFAGMHGGLEEVLFGVDEGVLVVGGGVAVLRPGEIEADDRQAEVLLGRFNQKACTFFFGHIGEDRLCTGGFQSSNVGSEVHLSLLCGDVCDDFDAQFSGDSLECIMAAFPKLGVGPDHCDLRCTKVILNIGTELGQAFLGAECGAEDVRVALGGDGRAFRAGELRIAVLHGDQHVDHCRRRVDRTH